MRDQEKIERIFRTSSSPDELFDCFNEAMRKRIKEPDTYKVLLANPTLSPDEVKMFTEKLIKEIPRKAFDFNMWTASVFENYLTDYERLEDSLNYYHRALFYKPTSNEPLLKLLNLYNYDLDIPSNRKIINIIEDMVAVSEKRSEVYYALANHYRKIGNNRMEVKCLSLAEKIAASESKT